VDGTYTSGPLVADLGSYRETAVDRSRPRATPTQAVRFRPAPGTPAQTWVRRHTDPAPPTGVPLEPAPPRLPHCCDDASHKHTTTNPPPRPVQRRGGSEDHTAIDYIVVTAYLLAGPLRPGPGPDTPIWRPLT
jgi:hypothetical protein